MISSPAPVVDGLDHGGEGVGAARSGRWTAAKQLAHVQPKQHGKEQQL